MWLSQSVFQLAKGNPKFPEQLLMGGFTANQITVGALVIAGVFGAGLIYWGNRFKTLPPDDDHRLRAWSAGPCSWSGRSSWSTTRARACRSSA